MMSTIQISKETKQRLSHFGTKEDSYEDIIKKICDDAAEKQLQQFLMSSENSISIDEAIKRAEETWKE